MSSLIYASIHLPYIAFLASLYCEVLAHYKQPSLLQKDLSYMNFKFYGIVELFKK
jgi:hypothetical protein